MLDTARRIELDDLIDRQLANLRTLADIMAAPSTPNQIARALVAPGELARQSAHLAKLCAERAAL